MQNLKLAALAALLWSAAGLAVADPVKVEGGLLQGTIEQGHSVYRGVPFAAPPVGELRWKAPRPAAKWSGVRKAEAFAPGCIGNGPSSSEDCLYLNLWSPAKSPRDKLPVLVWIYGGGFGGGQTSNPVFSGEQFADKGVIYVSIAYRVGPLGFLAHPGLSAEDPHHVSGNYGLLDQIEALKWIKRNIAAVGGDPNRVTIFGESAGGIAVSMLAASPLAKDLFQGAVSESGGSFSAPTPLSLPGENLVRLKDAEKSGLAYGQRLGAKTIAELRALTPQRLMERAAGAPTAVGPQPRGLTETIAWPVLDGWVIPDDQYKLYAAGRYNKTPVLIGINSDEGASFSAPTTLATHQDYVRWRYGPFADRLLAAYSSSDDPTAKQASRDLMRDAGFGWHTWAWARLQSAQGPKVFYYFFEQRPPYVPGSRAADAKGAPHGSEVAYVFGHLDLDKAMTWRPEDRAVSAQMVAAWANFAKFGNPNGPGVPAWPAFTKAKPAVMYFNAKSAAGPVPNPSQLEVLDGYFAWRRTPAGAK